MIKKKRHISTSIYLKKNKKKVLFSLFDFFRNFSVISLFFYSTNDCAQHCFGIVISKLQFQNLQAAPKSTKYDFSKLSIFIGQILISVTLRSFVG